MNEYGPSVDVLGGTLPADLVAQETDNLRLRHDRLNERYCRLLDAYERSLNILSERVSTVIDEAREMAAMQMATTSKRGY